MLYYWHCYSIFSNNFESINTIYSEFIFEVWNKEVLFFLKYSVPFNLSASTFKWFFYHSFINNFLYHFFFFHEKLLSKAPRRQSSLRERPRKFGNTEDISFVRSKIILFFVKCSLFSILRMSIMRLGLRFWKKK